MDVSPALAGFRDSAVDRTFLARLGRQSVWTLLLLLAVAGVLVCVRRATGSLAQPVSPPALLLLALLLSAAALAFRHMAAIRGLRSAARLIAWSVPTLLLIVWSLGILLPGHAALGLVAFVGPLVIEEGWSWGRFSWKSSGRQPAAPPQRYPAIAALEDDSPLEVEDAVTDESVSQSIVRRRAEQGETIAGWTRVSFVAEQRHAVAHVAICPPLDRPPECYAEQLDGPPADVKVAQVLPQGVRFEIKLNEPAAEPTSVVVEFSIQETAP